MKTYFESTGFGSRSSSGRETGFRRETKFGREADF